MIVSVTVTRGSDVLVFWWVHLRVVSNTNYMKSGLWYFLHVAILLIALRCNSAHNRPNTFWLTDSSVSTAGLSHVIALRGTDWSVQLKVDISMNLQFKIVTKKSLQQNEGHLHLVLYCTTHRDKCLYAFHSSYTDCIWTHSLQHPDKPALLWHTNIFMRLKPKQCVRFYDDMYSQLHIL